MAGGGLAVVLHVVEDAFDHVPPLVRLPVAIPWGRTVPLGRRGRRPGGIPLVRAFMDGCAPMNAPGAAIGRRPWAASCPAPKLGWVSTTVLPPSDAT